MIFEQSNVNFWASTIKINKHFGWAPKVDIDIGIKKTWESLK